MGGVPAAYPATAAWLFAVAYAASSARAGPAARVAGLAAVVGVLARAAGAYAGLGPPGPAAAGLGLALAAAAGAHLDGRGAGVRYALFAGLLYLCASATEWLVHRYVMHCAQHAPGLRRVRALRDICDSHAAHHLSTRADMSLSETPDPLELVFDWRPIAKLVAVLAPAMVALDAALGLRVGWRASAAAVAASGLVFGVVWNSTHPDMHDYAGPFPAGMPPRVRGLGGRLLTSNHVAHHQVKGERKGNYNVVYLGADELFGTNRLKSQK